MTPKIQPSLFEDDFLIRTLGEIAYAPEVAISELVANAWDAGASFVKIEIPEEFGQVISVEDDGVGLTKEQFLTRWMKLGYRRQLHQGEWAEFPSSCRTAEKRKAYGRNGLGRHALLCFAEEYFVETLRDGEEISHRFTVKPASNDSPFNLTSTETIERDFRGTRVWAHVHRNLPSIVQITDAISFTFLSNPNFLIHVNGKKVDFDSFERVHEEEFDIPNGKCQVKFLKLPEAAKGRTGVAFWVGNRLVGQPGYQILGTQLIDGRSIAARNHVVIVKSDDLFDYVKPDWSGFIRSGQFLMIAEEVACHVNKVAAKLNASAIEETKKAAYIENRDGIRKLTVLGKTELKEFVDGFVSRVPGINADVLAAGVAAAVNLEQSRSGVVLLQQLASIPVDDIEKLSNLLQDWTVKDALLVLDEIGRRASAVEAIKKLMGDSLADELHTMHPLIAHCRWLFGPDFESPHFLSNTTIRAAAENVFKKKIDASQISNPRKRPDLVFTKQSTFGITSLDTLDAESGIAKLSKLLLIELKRGDAKIVLSHVHQAEEYIQDLRNCQLLDGSPQITAFVVGHKIDPRLPTIVRVGDPEYARIHPVSFGQLVRTAEARLFGLSKNLEQHFRNSDAAKLIDGILGGVPPSLFPEFESRGSGKKYRGAPKKTAKRKPR